MDQNNPLVSLVGSIEVGSILILRIDFHFLGNRYPCEGLHFQLYSTYECTVRRNYQYIYIYVYIYISYVQYIYICIYYTHTYTILQTISYIAVIHNSCLK